MTPFLIFLGIPPTYAVANEANNILGISVSGALTHWFRKTLDYKMGLYIVSGGIAGTIVGILIFGYLKEIGVINVIISLAYIYVLFFLTQHISGFCLEQYHVMTRRLLRFTSR